VTHDAAAEDRPIRIGVSSCLLGEAVRYDGGHKRNRFVTDALDPFVEWVPVCPELESGLGVPRPAMRLVRGGAESMLLEIASGRDHTQRMRRFAGRRVRSLREFDLCGYVLKKGSPSCGMMRVKTYGEGGRPRRDGRGLYATALMEAYPHLPVEDEGRLDDARLRENFIERLFAYRRLLDLFDGRWTTRRVVAFHTAHELQLMTHGAVARHALGRMVTDLAGLPRAELRERYAASFMGALSKPASPTRNANVLRHATGHLKKRITASSRDELAELIHAYRHGQVPLVVPVMLLRHHARLHDIAYLNGQTYLKPHPKELMLRNRV
jgi:uncharacterized protein YbbK (DUF523 family)/uncharacterized protein YbgA (DUF1722 family)